MSEVRRSIAAPPEAVWEVLADPTTYPDWLIGAQDVRAVEPGFPEPGSEFHHNVGLADEVSVADSTTALHADRPRSMALKVRARPFFEGIVRYRLVPTKAGTELVLDEEPVGVTRVLAPLLRPLIVARNARSLERLAALVESRAGAEPAG